MKFLFQFQCTFHLRINNTTTILNNTSIISIFPSHFIFFYLRHGIRKRGQSNSLNVEPPPPKKRAKELACVSLKRIPFTSKVGNVEIYCSFIVDV